MLRRREDRLHQAPDNEPVNGPPGERSRSVWSHQSTYLFYGIILTVLLMFDGVELIDQDHHYPRSSSIKSNKSLHFLDARDAPAANISTTLRPGANRDHYPRIPSSRSNSSAGITQTKHVPAVIAGTLNASTTRPVARSEKPTPDINAGPGPCLSDDCQRLRKETLSKMNTAVDRCDNFYGYACGGFVKNTKIANEKNMENTFTKLDGILQEQMTWIVTSMYINLDPPYRAASKLYERCMDTKRIEAEGNKTLLEILDSLGGWPVLKGQAWNTGPWWAWEQSMKNIRKLGYSIDCLFDVSVEEDLKNASRRILYVDQPTLSISREDLVQGMNNSNVKNYLETMVNASAFLGANKLHTRSELENLLNYEMKLADVTLPKEVRRNATAMYNPMSVKDFQSKYDYTNWIDYFNSMLENTSIKIDENEIINVKAPSYFTGLSTLLKAPNRTIANYVMWRIVQFSSPFLTKKVRQDVLGVQQKHDNRTKECVDFTIQRLPLVVETFYDKEFIDDSSKHNVLKMAHEIRKEFVDTLKKVDWMDKNTRENALGKLNTMVFSINHTDERMDDRKLMEYYRGLGYIPEVSYLRTVLYIDKFSTTKKFKELRQSVKKTTTYLDPVGVKVHHSFSENSIRFAPYYVQKPLFSYFWPKCMKYGVMGSVIGRAIARIFVDQRWHFDQIGNPSDWNKTDTGIAFLQKAFCVFNHHVKVRSNYKTVAEKITDISGILIAYQAYQNSKKNGPDELLPNLSLTSDQMFWLSAAQAWCSVYRPEANDMCIKGSTSPDQFRVLESMRNLVEFSNDFNCTLESRRNPVEICNVW